MAYVVFTIEGVVIEIIGIGVIQVTDTGTSWNEIVEVLIFSPVAFLYFLFIPLIPFYILPQWCLFVFLFILNILLQRYLLKVKFNWFIIGLNLSVWMTFANWVAVRVLSGA